MELTYEYAESSGRPSQVQPHAYVGGHLNQDDARSNAGFPGVITLE